MQTIILTASEKCLRFIDHESIEVTIHNPDTDLMSTKQVEVICRCEQLPEQRHHGKIIANHPSMGGLMSSMVTVKIQRLNA